MVKFEADELRKIMDSKENIRNVSVIANASCGKSTLIDSLLSTSGIFAQEGDDNVQSTDTPAEHGITTKSTCISLYYNMKDEAFEAFKGVGKGNEYLFNLIDPPGDIDVLAEVSTALRLTDGALVVVDCVDGVSLQTECVLHQAIYERVKPVLNINKIDQYFLEYHVDGEEAYVKLNKVIEEVNTIMETFEDPSLGDLRVYPGKGTVAFSAGLHGWAFNLSNFSKWFAPKLGVDESKMMQFLWGDFFYDPNTQEWTTENTGSKSCKRGFVQFCYDPIKKIIAACMDDRKDDLWKLLSDFGIYLDPEDLKLMGEALVKCVMKIWLPASNILEMMIVHLPSPVKAQAYRVENLYKGPMDDIYATAMRKCDPRGPLMIYVSKMIWAPNEGRFLALARVFSGTVAAGLKVRIMGPNYVIGNNVDVYFEVVKETAIWRGRKWEVVEKVPCGNIVVMVGLDRVITKCATLTDEKETAAHLIRLMMFSSTRVTRIAVQCKARSDHPKLGDALKLFCKTDPLVASSIHKSGEYILAGTSEAHIQRCFKTLQQYFMNGVEILASPPFPIYRETICGISSSVTRQSENIQLSMKARPLKYSLSDAIDDGVVGPKMDPEARTSILVEKFNWNNDATENIWCFGPENRGPNMLVDVCEGVEHNDNLKKSVISSFQWVTSKGVLAEEEMRGVCLELENAGLEVVGGDDKGAESVRLAREVMKASLFAAEPRIMEPFCLVEIQAPRGALSSIKSLVEERHGNVFYQKPVMPGAPLYKMKTYLSVSKTFGLSRALRNLSSGPALSHCVFHHWGLLPSDPLTDGSEAHLVVKQLRMIKGLEHDLPTLG